VKTADLLGLLVGRRESILNIARSRQAFWVGLLLVASAAMAREYDRHWLVADWWHLLLPFVASVAMAFVQFALFWFRRDRLESDATFGQSFRAFLACFWMTAPLAWAYAIPYERFLSPADAVAANLWTLAVVSLLRGIIICRVLQVIANVAYWRALVVSAGVVQVILAVVAYYGIGSMVDLMGGIRHTPEDVVIRGTIFLIAAETIYVGWAVVLLAWASFAHMQTRFMRSDTTGGQRASGIAWTVPILVTIAFIICLPWTQPPWQRAHRADELIRANDIPGALAFMNQHPRDAFPPDWRPLPKTSRFFDRPNLLDVLNQIDAVRPDSWLRRYYLSELERAYLGGHISFLPDELVIGVEALLDRLPEGVDLKQRHADTLADIRRYHGLSPATTQSTQPSTP
jgi:hypothetical protein